MRLSDVVGLAGNGIRERKFRFALNIVGILIGSAAIMSLVSVTQGMSQDVNRQIEQFSPTSITVMSGGGVFGFGPGGGGQAGGTRTQLTLREVDRVEKIPHVQVATPVISRTALVKIGGRTDSAQVIGIVPDEYVQIVSSINVNEGRFLVRSDVSSAVIGVNIAQPSTEDEPIAGVGDRIVLEIQSGEEVKTVNLRIAGILEPLGPSLIANQDDSIYVTVRTAQQIFDTGNVFSSIAVKADSTDTVDGVVEAIRDELGEGVSVISSTFIRNTVGSIIGIISAVLGGVAAISLIVAGVGIINTMTISVFERTREIGIMKAIGAKSRDVLLMFLSESLMMGTLGGGAGVLLGAVLGQVVSSIAQFSIGVTISSAPTLGNGVLVIAFSLITGAISGLYPAWRGAHLKPVEALRYE